MADDFKLIADEPAAPARPPEPPAPRVKKAKVPVVRRPFTRIERARATELAGCRFGSNYFARRFAETVAGADEAGIGITDKQASRLEVLCWTYRRQLPSAVVPGSTPDLCWPSRKKA